MVKKDSELSSYSFVSFRVACPINIFEALLDAKNWPSYCQIREFDMVQKNSSGIRLNSERSKSAEEGSSTSHEQNNLTSKNEEAPQTADMEMETAQ